MSRLVLLPLLLMLASAIVGARALNNGMGLVPPLGWSTWCSNGPCGKDYCDENMVRAAASAMLTNGMADAGYTWVLLDDCWAAGHRAPDGQLTWDTDRFPSGIPALVDWLHSKDLKLGLYTSAGNTTCSSGGRPYPIPGSEYHFQQDMNTFASWNTDYVKVDWCGDVKQMPLDGIAVGAKYYGELSAALTNSTPKRSMYFEGVAAVLFLLKDVGTYVNAWRASTDHHDQWSNLVEIIATVEIAGVPSTPGAWSYLDVLMTGGEGCSSTSLPWHCPGMTNDEYHSEFALWSIYQSPLIVSTAVSNMTSIMTELLLNKKILAIHQDTSYPAGKHRGGDKRCVALSTGTVLPLAEVTCEYFTRPMNNYTVVAMTNLADEPVTMHFNPIEEMARTLSKEGSLSPSIKAALSTPGNSPLGASQVRVVSLWSGAVTILPVGQVYQVNVPTHGTDYFTFSFI